VGQDAALSESSVLRSLRLEVRDRVNYKGEGLGPLDERGVLQATVFLGESKCGVSVDQYGTDICEGGSNGVGWGNPYECLDEAVQGLGRPRSRSQGS
jgi:hypothetical protein